MDGWECRRADQPFLRAAEEAEVQATGVEPWVADAAVVAHWTALALGVLERAFVAAACAAG